MKNTFKKRRPQSPVDHLSLAVTTFGVGYIPGAPGTYGSLLAVGFYYLLASGFGEFRYAPSASSEFSVAAIHAVILIAFLLFIFLGIWAAGRSAELLGSTDAPEAVVDEIIGQLIVFLFIPFTQSPLLIGAGFLLFRLFDIWKPYPINYLQSLPRGIGVCADDILAGIYAGIGLSVLYAATLWF